VVYDALTKAVIFAKSCVNHAPVSLIIITLIYVDLHS